MGSLNCFVCSLPFPEAEARYVKNQPVCTQCQNVVGKGEATKEASAAAAPAPSPAQAPGVPPPPKPAPKITMPVGGGNLYYEHSGSWTAGGVFMMSAAGFLSSAILGLVYGYFHYWNPFIYFNAAGTFFLGLIVGGVVGETGKFMDQRSTGMAAALGALMGLFTVAWAWSVWIKAAGLAPGFLFDPMEILAVIKAAAGKTVWQIKGITIEGLAVKVIWIMEAGVILILPLLVAAGMIGNAPYCERCGLWLPEPFKVEKLAPIIEPENFRTNVERGIFAPAAALSRLNGEPSTYTRLEVSSCPGCRGINVFSAVACTVTKEEGEVSVDEDLVVDQLLVNAEVRDWLTKGF